MSNLFNIDLDSSSSSSKEDHEGVDNHQEDSLPFPLAQPDRPDTPLLPRSELIMYESDLAQSYLYMYVFQQWVILHVLMPRSCVQCHQPCDTLCTKEELSSSPWMNPNLDPVEWKHSLQNHPLPPMYFFLFPDSTELCAACEVVWSSQEHPPSAVLFRIPLHRLDCISPTTLRDMIHHIPPNQYASWFLLELLYIHAGISNWSTKIDQWFCPTWTVQELNTWWKQWETKQPHFIQPPLPTYDPFWISIPVDVAKPNQGSLEHYWPSLIQFLTFPKHEKGAKGDKEIERSKRALIVRWFPTWESTFTPRCVPPESDEEYNYTALQWLGGMIHYVNEESLATLWLTVWSNVASRVSADIYGLIGSHHLPTTLFCLVLWNSVSVNPFLRDRFPWNKDGKEEEEEEEGKRGRGRGVGEKRQKRSSVSEIPPFSGSSRSSSPTSFSELISMNHVYTALHLANLDHMPWIRLGSSSPTEEEEEDYQMLVATYKERIYSSYTTGWNLYGPIPFCPPSFVMDYFTGMNLPTPETLQQVLTWLDTRYLSWGKPSRYGKLSQSVLPWMTVKPSTNEQQHCTDFVRGMNFANRIWFGYQNSRRLFYIDTLARLFCPKEYKCSLAGPTCLLCEVLDRTHPYRYTTVSTLEPNEMEGNKGNKGESLP